MRTFSSNLTAQRNLLRTKSVWLWAAEIEADDSTVLYYTNQGKDVVFNGRTYQKKGMVFNPMTQDGAGKLPAWRVTIDNTDQVMVAYLEGGKLFGRKFRARILNSDYLSSAADCWDIDTIIVDASADEQWVTLRLGDYDLERVKIPRSCYYREFCRFKFKDRRCQYAGGASACDKRWETCDLLGNALNYGGFPSMPYVHR